jgi:malate dehydrogenase
MEFQYLNSFRRGVEKVAADTMVEELLTGLGTSAWYAPGASVAYLVDSILNDQKKMIACSVFC